MKKILFTALLIFVCALLFNKPVTAQERPIQIALFNPVNLP